MSNHRSHRIAYIAVVALCMVMGVALRLVGLQRGGSDLAAGRAEAFHVFHPDEGTLVRAALSPITPLEPPFTAYGLLPVYVLRAALWMQGADAADVNDVYAKKTVYATARLIAILLSCAVLVLTWLLGRELAGPQGRLLGLIIVAFAPGALQQAHFFIVDGFFAAFSLAGVVAILRAVETGDRRWYVAVGLLVGALGAVRFNGLALGGVLLAGHLVARRRWNARQLWLSGVIAAGTVLVLQPYILVHPDLLAQTDSSDDFAKSLLFARLEYLQPWTLVDVHATRWWDHWWVLWPAIGGWPLTVALLGGVAFVAWRGTRQQRLALLWCSICFASVGALPVKAVRYFVPLLPVLGLCAAALSEALWLHRRWMGGLLGAGLTVPIVVYGVAFAHIYHEEDARIQAGKWIRDTVPKGETVALESGAFNLREIIDPQRYEHLSLNVSGLFYGSQFMLCGQQVDYLQDYLENANWLAVVEENRAVQFRAVPELFPVVNDFYKQLFSEQLGFRAVQQIAVEPELFGIAISDRDAEPSFLGYDHPTVRIFQRTSRAKWQAWRERMAKTAACPDADLRALSTALIDGDEESMQQKLAQLDEDRTYSPLVHLLEAAMHWHMGNEMAGEAAYQRYLPSAAHGYWNHLRESPFAHYVPADAAVALLELGLEELALEVMRRGVEDLKSVDRQRADEMAQSYLNVAHILWQRDRAVPMEDVAAQSLRIYPSASAHNALAMGAHQRGDYAGVLAHWQSSLQLDGAQGDIHAALGQLLLTRYDSPPEALKHLEQALLLLPEHASTVRRWINAARARVP